MKGFFKLKFLGIHPTTISESFQRAAVEAEKILESMSTSVDLKNEEELNRLATTSLNSKVIVNFTCIFFLGGFSIFRIIGSNGC